MGDDPGTTRTETLEAVLEAVYLYFKGDREKVDQWLQQPNPQLGGDTPMSMIRANRLDTLVDLIRVMIGEL